MRKLYRKSRCERLYFCYFTYTRKIFFYSLFMRFFLIVLSTVLSLSFVSLVFPVSAVVNSAVSGELVLPLATPKISTQNTKKSLLERQIRLTKAAIAKLDLSINALEKKLQTSKMTPLLLKASEKKLQALKSEKKNLERTLALLEKQLSLLIK